MQGETTHAYQRKTADAIASAVKASRVPQVVLLSSVGADLPSGTGPIQGLHYAENVLRETGTVLSAIRAGFFQGAPPINVASRVGPAGPGESGPACRCLGEIRQIPGQPMIAFDDEL